MTQTSTPRRPVAPVTPVVWWVPLTLGGYGNTDDAYVLAETANDAQAAAVLAGMTIRPGAWVTAGIPRSQEILEGRSMATQIEAPADVKVWNFGPGAGARLATGTREKRVEIRVTEMSWFRIKPTA